MCVCVYICMYYMHVYIEEDGILIITHAAVKEVILNELVPGMYVRTYVCMYVCVYVCMCVCVYVYVCMCVRVYVCACV